MKKRNEIRVNKTLGHCRNKKEGNSICEIKSKREKKREDVPVAERKESRYVVAPSFKYRVFKTLMGHNIRIGLKGGKEERVVGRGTP